MASLKTYMLYLNRLVWVLRGLLMVTNMRYLWYHAPIQKILSEGVQFWRFFIFFLKVDGGGGGWWWWPNIECWLGSFEIAQGIWTRIARKPYIFVIFQGRPGPPAPHPLDLNMWYHTVEHVMNRTFKLISFPIGSDCRRWIYYEYQKWWPAKRNEPFLFNWSTKENIDIAFVVQSDQYRLPLSRNCNGFSL